MKAIKSLLLIFISFVAACLMGATADVHIHWLPPEDITGVVGYNAWVGTNSCASTTNECNYDYYVYVPGATNTEVIFCGLTVATRYYFSVESVNVDGMVGPMSEEIVVIPPGAPRHLTVVIEEG